jgi:hypothetical protein
VRDKQKQTLDEKDQSWQDFKQLLSSRIKAAEDGEISTKPLSQIAKEELNGSDK